MPVTPTIPLLHCSDGGYSNQVGEEEGSTNPTAAVIGILTVCDGLQIADLRGVAAFLLNMQAEDGGFVPHRLALESDLLSTFTALWTLFDIGGLQSARTADAGRFLKSVSRNASGGFGSTVTDHSPDIEYTYYGIGALSLLSLIV
jgi:geranylgeranyl transferase type-2 subunit beta